jgi:DNA replication and repair protein RecF
LFFTQYIPLVQELFAFISEGKESPKLDYSPSTTVEQYKQDLLLNRHKDLILQRTTIGIHKDDLVFVMNGQPLRAYASQGQLKSFVLALKIAQYKMLEINTQEKPILLLDDIFDKLDPNRVSQLLKLLVDKEFGQIFITDTDAVRTRQVLDLSGSDYSIFGVEQGQVSHL